MSDALAWPIVPAKTKGLRLSHPIPSHTKAPDMGVAGMTGRSLPAETEPDRIIGVICPNMGQGGFKTCVMNERTRVGSER